MNEVEYSGSGVFDRTNPRNALKDWNIVFVPYRTGDVHAGNDPDGLPPGVSEPQQFVGYANVALYLKWIIPRFSNATQVLLAGESAGGFGALLNYEQVARAFSGVRVDMVDDKSNHAFVGSSRALRAVIERPRRGAPHSKY